jgi:uncharacterized RDD family membrane protein YckC
LPAPAEQVVLASWGRRAGAWLIDYFIWAIPGFALAIPMMVHMFHYFETHPGAPPPGVQPDVELIFGSGFALYQGVGILLTLGQIAYQIVLNGHPRGQTVGKMAFGIQVRNASNMDTLGYGRSTARWLVGYALLLACIVPGIVDLLFPLWDDKRQTIHDKAAGSLVIRLQRI